MGNDLTIFQKPSVLLGALVTFCLAPGSFAQEVIRIGYFDLPPHVTGVGEEGPEGTAISYFNEYIAPELGVPIQWDIKPNPPTRLMDQLRSGERDAMIFLGKTEERTEYLHYPDPYLTIPETLAFLKGNAPGSINDVSVLHGMTIGFLVGGRIPEKLRVEQIKYDLIAGKRLFERNVEKLLAGRVDAIYAPLSTALKNIIIQMDVSDQIELVPINFLEPVNIYTVFSKKTVDESIVKKYSQALSAATNQTPYLEYLEHNP